MATTYDEIIELFFRRIEKDRSFFNYIGLTDEENAGLATERANGFLEEAIARFEIGGYPAIDFEDRTDSQFNFDLTTREKSIIASLMYEQYINRDLSYLKTLNINGMDKAMTAYDPSKARTSFLAISEKVKLENDEYLDIYKNSDRNTGKFIKVSFADYDEEDS